VSNIVVEGRIRKREGALAIRQGFGVSVGVGVLLCVLGRIFISGILYGVRIRLDFVIG
jgi:hypothetical protein